MANNYAWDSFGPLIGVATRPSNSRLIAPRGLNMDFRNGNEPRRGLFGMVTEFEDEADRKIFETGNVQKFASYGNYGNRPAALMVLVAGTIFACFISGKKLRVRKIWEGLRPDLMMGWMCQAFEWFVVQNGSDKPIIWDGRTAFQSDPSKAEMPIGGPMAFIHHSIAVCSTDGTDKIAVSDRWAQTHSERVWQFGDTPTWDNAGVFGLHANFGKIMALAIIPQIKQTPNGQGDLFIGGTNGAQTLNLQMARSQFLDSQIQDTALVGSGLASYNGIIPTNSSLYYIGESGLQEVLRERTAFTQSDATVIESGDVDLYWKQSNPNLRPFTPLGNHDNRIFMGLLPETSKSGQWGTHRYFNAWSTLDVSERYRNGQKLPRAWYGLQCGPRPIEWVSNLLVNRVHRTYMMSHDADGVNRIYEVTNSLVDDVVDGRPVQVKSFFVSPTLGNRKSEILRSKTPIAARLDFKDASGNTEIGISWRGESTQCWTQWSDVNQQRSTVESIERFELPSDYGGSIVFSDPASDNCEFPSPTEVRLKINMLGRMDASNVYVKFKESESNEDGLRDIFKDGCGAEAQTTTCADDFELYHTP